MQSLMLVSNTCIAIIVFTVCFLFFHFTTSSNWYRKIFADSPNVSKNNQVAILLQRYLGFVLFGLIPLIILQFLSVNLKDVGISINEISTSIKWIFGLGIIIVSITYFTSKNPENLSMYPQIRASKWNVALLVHSSFAWIMYLIGYEFMFRGFLFFLIYKDYGLTTSIVINVCLYSLVHISKGYKETFGAIALGIVLCVLTIQTGSLLIAIGTHCCLALSNEWFSLKYQSDMHLSWKLK